MKQLSLLLAVLLTAGLFGCTAPSTQSAASSEPTSLQAPTVTPQETRPDISKVDSILASMTLEEKVGQMILARCPDTEAAAHVSQYHLAGYVLFGRDFAKETPETISRKLESYQAEAKIPLVFAVDEEGGTVARVSAYAPFRESRFPSPRSLFAEGGMDALLAVEKEKAQLLSGLGIRVNLAPVCDITTNPQSFMYDRSLGLDPAVTGEFVSKTVSIMASYQCSSVLKHFPGYGDNTDTHIGIAVDNRSLEALESRDLIPFQQGIQAGCGAIMVSHTFVNAMDSQLPASLSPEVHSYLREKMGFFGVIMTDDLRMDGIYTLYGDGEAAVLAVLAGNDLLCTSNYIAQYNAILQAAKQGRISEDILDAAVRRVLCWKEQMQLLDNE